jgi:hypothetical protein
MSLPKGYKRLEYIQSSGTQCIDTGFKPNQNSGVSIDFQLNAVSGWQCVFGTRVGNNTRSYSLWHSGSAFGFYYSSVNATFSNLAGTVRHTVVATKNTAVADGASSVSLTYSNFTASYPLFLFAVNSDGQTQSIASMKLFSCQIYDDGTLVRDFVPCMTDTGEIGLWDDVNFAFYGNAGTGEFIAGPEVATTPKAPANFRVESETDTLVTLTWDASEKAVGYRLYRSGQLLADTEETSVSVTVEIFAGAVFTLTAYNENGEGAGTELIYFNAPDDPILFLVTDRTQQDVAERNPKGYYAASDLNRVGYAVDYLQKRLLAAGVSVAVSPVLAWTDEEWATPSAMTAYLKDVQTMRNALKVAETTPAAPEDMAKMTYSEANDIEAILVALDAHITRMLSIVDAGWASGLAYTGFYAKEAY